jgi:hypothetical protein
MPPRASPIQSPSSLNWRQKDQHTQRSLQQSTVEVHGSSTFMKQLEHVWITFSLMTKISQAKKL